MRYIYRAAALSIPLISGSIVASQYYLYRKMKITKTESEFYQSLYYK